MRFIALLLISLLASAGALAQTLPDTNPYFAKVGGSVFVSGPFQEWVGDLKEALRLDSGVKRVVFVNTVSERQERVDWGILHAKYMRERGDITTVIVGRCDMFCARSFAGGSVRQFGQDLSNQKALIELQTPIDWETKQLETKFPFSQFIPYEQDPNAMVSKDIYTEAFSRGGMTGGLRVYPDQAPEFCAGRNPDAGCKTYQTDGVKLGLLTTTERATIDLPPGFPAPVASGFADLRDVDAVPGSAAVKAGYSKYISYSYPNRSFAISVDGKAFGRSEGAAATLKKCQEFANGSPCRLYARGDNVIW